MPTQKAPPPQEPGVVVEVAKAAVARVAPRRWVPGGVVSRNDARLATSAAGRLEYVAEVGTRVRAGERVAKLEDEAVRLRVEDAKAEVARIESQRAMSERQLQRLEKLGSTISQTQLDEVRSQLAVLTAQLQQAQVRQRVAQHDLDQTELRAPFAGVVTERLAQRGEYVATGAAIAHLVDTVHLEARVQAPLTLVGLVRQDMELPVRIADRQIKASVRTVVPVGEERSRQFELRLTLANNALSVGTAIEVGLPEREAAESLVVPRDAIAVTAGWQLRDARARGQHGGESHGDVRGHRRRPRHDPRPRRGGRSRGRARRRTPAARPARHGADPRGGRARRRRANELQ